MQRFGSKRGLLLAASARASEGTIGVFARLRHDHASPIAALHAYADCVAQSGGSANALAHGLSYLQLDLTDPDFHRHALTHARATRSALRTLVLDAIAAGEVVPTTNAEILARELEVTITGSLMTWAVYQEGSATSWLHDDLTTLLQVHLTAKGRRRLSALNRVRLPKPPARANVSRRSVRAERKP